MPDTDLARIAPLDIDSKRKALERHKLGFAPYSYEPVRASTLDILNARMELFADAQDTPWAQVQGTIVKASRGNPAEAKANLEVAELLYRFARMPGNSADYREFGTFGSGAIRYWANVVLNWEGTLFIAFPDYRREGLSALGRRFAASVMHERVRAINPDLAAARLGFIQFPAADRTSRAITLTFAEETELFGYEMLQSMITETYAIWGEVSEGRAEENRRAGGASGGLL